MPGPLCLCHSSVLLQTPSQMGTRFPLIQSSSCLSGFPGLGKAAERVQPVLLEQPVPPGAWHGAPSAPSPSGHARPSVRWAHPPARLCFVVLGDSEKSIPKSAPSSQGQARGILLNAGKAEVGREETQSLDLMGRAGSSDQIIINDWVWGALPPPCPAPAPPCPRGKSSQPEKESWGMEAELLLFLLD